MPILYLKGTVTGPHQSPWAVVLEHTPDERRKVSVRRLLSAERIERRHFDFHVPVFR